MTYVSTGTRINDLLGMFGISGGKIGAAIDARNGDTIGMLMNLRDAAIEAATGRATNRFERVQNQQYMGMGEFGGSASPASVKPFMQDLCGNTYSKVDLAPGSPSGWLANILSPERRNAAQFEKLLKENPQVRAAFEAQMGGRIVSFGSDNDGKFVIQRDPFMQALSQMGGPLGNPLMAQVGQMLQMMNPLGGAMGGLNPLMGLMLPGLGNILGGLFGGGGGMGGLGALLGGGGLGALGSLLGGGGLGSLLGGLGGFGSMNPLARSGLINNNSTHEENQHQAQIDSVLHDPSLTVEDRVMLMLMLICKKMDKDIQQQSEYINRIQQQQGGQGANGSGVLGSLGGIGGLVGSAFGPVGGMVGGLAGNLLGGLFGGGNSNAPGQDGAASVDIETKKLERMVQKRSQMFEMLKGIMEKYDATTKSVAQSLGR